MLHASFSLSSLACTSHEHTSTSQAAIFPKSALENFQNVCPKLSWPVRERGPKREIRRYDISLKLVVSIDSLHLDLGIELRLPQYHTYYRISKISLQNLCPEMGMAWPGNRSYDGFRIKLLVSIDSLPKKNIGIEPPFAIYHSI